jgi:4-amino-4-deoxy-L-arabinose transferase-like glycosyltransferase
MNNLNKILIIIIGFAIVLRLFVFLELKNSPVIQVPIADSKTYIVLAGDILRGDILASGTVFTNPFYFYFIALIQFFFGFISSDYYAVIFSQIILSTISIYFIYRISIQIFIERVAILTVIFASVYEILIFFDNTLLSVTLINFLNAGMILLLFEYYLQKKKKYLFFSGLLCGLSIITRGNLLLFLPFVLIWFILIKDGWSIFLKNAVLFISGVLVFTLIIIIRNYAITSELVPISSNMGYNFYIGNNEKANGTYRIPEFIHSTYQYYEEKQSEQEAEHRTGKKLTHNEASNYWFKEAFNFIIKNPSKYLSLIYQKTYLFFNNTETANNISNYTAREHSVLLKYLPQNFGILSGLGILGIIFSLRNLKDKRILLLVSFVLSYFIANLAVMTASEYRAPVILYFLMFGSYALNELYRLAESGKYLKLIYVLIPLLLLIYWTNYPDEKLKQYRNTDADYAAFGNELTLSKIYEEANRMYLKAIEENPADKYLYYRIASNCQRDNDAVNALKYYKLTPNIDALPDSVKLGYLELSSNELFSQNDFTAARKILERIIRYEPDNYVLLNNLGTCCLNMDLLDDAESYFKKTVVIKANYSPALANLGLIEEKKGYLANAILYFQKTVDIDGTLPQYKLKLVELYLKAGQTNKANEISSALKATYPRNSTVITELNRILQNKGIK